ncbi:DOG1 domain-containing protein [Cynara cardunculus var. scolymus]|uniref:DOG1 domain-containing protein n=1 Tax=Cynara cardunculus var. scolymus TaxID=59895 RepID=A0A118K116_CYNCS|nr:DOG1 domain-containing protein [Cynara cardunculus var. scolymus]
MKHQQFQCCYHNWVAQQRLDLDELLQTLTHYWTDPDYLKLITNKIINHFENYSHARAELAKHDSPSFLAPTWGSTFENSFLWIGGCRPSLIIRIVYALCGSQLNAHFEEFLEGIRHGNLGEISTDAPLVLLANDHREAGETGRDEVVDKAMDRHALDIYNVLIEADKLRLSTLKGMIDILTPLQSVEFLVASKKLHLFLHEWSKRRDMKMGITHLLNTYNPSSSRDPPPPPEPCGPPPPPPAEP